MAGVLPEWVCVCVCMSLKQTNYHHSLWWTLNLSLSCVFCHAERRRSECLTEAGRAVEGHISNDSGPETRPHQQELLGHLFQASGPLACHLERAFPWEKAGCGGWQGVAAGVELTPRSALGLNPQERKTCQQVNYLICPRGHAFPLNYCLRGPRRCQGNQILQGHIWHIMEANGKLEDIINWKSCYADVKDSLPQVSLYGFSHRTAPVFHNHFSNPWRTPPDAVLH